VKVVLHDRTNGLGQEVRQGAQRKLARLERHFGKVLEAEVEFLEKRRTSDLTWFVCRVHLRLDGHRAPVLRAMERGADPQSALDLALDKLDRQVVAFKGR
jgi:ribosomal subunit interface protein